jgi:hypothetical protein
MEEGSGDNCWEEISVVIFEYFVAGVWLLGIDSPIVNDSIQPKPPMVDPG